MMGMGFAALFLFAALPAMADSLIEIRGGVGLVGTDPDEFNDQVKDEFGNGMDASTFDNYFVDAYLNIPVLPFGVGLRHEWLNDKASGGSNNWEMDVNNLTLLVDWRILDNWIYVGPIVGIGYPSGDLKYTGGSDSLDKDGLTYSLAGEAGFKLGRFIVGAEAGYSSMKLKTDDGETKVDLSGFYGKALVGIGLF
jgi:hypothetical protein